MESSSSDLKQSCDTSAQAKKYQAVRQKLFLWNLLLQGGALFLVWGSGLTFFFRDRAFALWPDPVRTTFLYFAFFSAYFLVLELPMEFYSGFWVEKKFGLSNHRFWTWVWEEAKKRFLSFVFSLVLVEALYFLLRSFSLHWWLFAWGGWILMTVLLGKVAHIVLLPLFYKSERLQNESLRGKLFGLFEKHHFPIREVYRINLSKTTKKANAAFAGFGSTRRIYLADTFLEHCGEDEIISVVAHELGHAKRYHLLKSLGFNSAVSFLAFYAVYAVLNHWARPLGFTGQADLAAFPLICLVGFLGGLILLPPGNILSRFHERQADDFALKEISNPSVFVSALRKLGETNLADFEPNPVIEFLLYSHPSLGKRIRHAERFSSK